MKSAPKYVEPEDESQDQPDEEPASVVEPEPEAAGVSNKSQAARAAIDAGYEKPGEAVAWIKKTYGIDMGGQHFGAIKSNYKKK